MIAVIPPVGAQIVLNGGQMTGTVEMMIVLGVVVLVLFFTRRHWLLS